MAYQDDNLGQSCPCDTTMSIPSTSSTTSTTSILCYRYEIFGIQPNHFVLFTLLGAAFPSYFVTFTILGAAFEYAEYLLDVNMESWSKICNYLGPCSLLNLRTLSSWRGSTTTCLSLISLLDRWVYSLRFSGMPGNSLA